MENPEKVQNQDMIQVMAKHAQKNLPVWHRPQLTRLKLNLDTAYTSGSNTDGMSGSAM